MAVRGFLWWLGYLGFKGLIHPVPEVYFRFKGLIHPVPEIYFRFKGLLVKYPRSENGGMT
jgi:hypothetical protein